MIVLRLLTFAVFLLTALGMVAWEAGDILRGIEAAGTSDAWVLVLGLAPAIVLAEFAADRALKGRARLLGLAVGSSLALPVVAPVAGILSLILGRGANHRRIWQAALTVGCLLGLNLGVSLLAGRMILPGGEGVTLGLLCVRAQFYLVVDYFLARAILHYFGSGASAFVSLRYLRRRTMSLLSVFGIAIGVLVLIVVNSIMTGFLTDFREQVRGNLSHVLVRFDSTSFHPGWREQDRLEWAEYVRRIEADAPIRREWNRLLIEALERFRLQRDHDDDALADLPENLHAQPPIAGGGDEESVEILPEPEDDAERAFLKRLRTAEGLTEQDRMCLIDGSIVGVTPREFYLARAAHGSEREREALEEEIRKVWFWPAYRANMRQSFEDAARILNEHRNPSGEPDVTGVSWRVSAKTFVAPKYRTIELPIAELTGVDPEHEPEISDLGEYVAAAEFERFKDRYALLPLQNLLGALLGWETQESLDATGDAAGFWYSEDGRNIGLLPQKMRNTLIRRRLLTSAEKVSWSSFDQIRFRDYTPAPKLYELLKETYKEILRTDDPREVKELLEEALAETRAILEAELAKAPPATPEEGVARTGSLIILQTYLTGVDASDRALRQMKEEYYDGVRILASDDSLSEEERDWLGEVLESLKNATENARNAGLVDPSLDEISREEVLLAAIENYHELLSQAADEADRKTFATSALELRMLAPQDAEPRDRLPFAGASGALRVLPLAYAVARFDDEVVFAERSCEAYRRVLPLRTSMRRGESFEVYAKRALTEGRRPLGGDEPGIVLGDALAKSPLLGGVDVGDTIALTIPRIYRDEHDRLVPKAIEVRFRVTALFHSGLYDENFGRMYCDFEELARLLGDSETRYIVGAKFKDYTLYEGDHASARLKHDLDRTLREADVPIASVGVWEDEKRSMLEAINREKVVLGLVVAFNILLAGALVVIVVYQLVNEKVKDIGILKALGHSPWGIRSVFMFNALFIGLFGAILGGAMGIGFSEYLNEIEDFIDQMTGVRLFPPDIYFLTYIPSVKGAKLVWLALDIAVPAVLWSFGCGILPSLAAARKDPIEALHHE